MRGEREKRQWEGQTRIGKGTNRKKKEKKEGLDLVVWVIRQSITYPLRPIRDPTSVQSVLDAYIRRICSLDTSSFSALQVLDDN